MYLKTIPVGDLQANCYILGAEYAMFVAVIDPGDNFNRIHKVLEADCKTPSLVLLTHAHPDHYGALSEFKAQYPDATICLHKDDEQLYESNNLRAALGYREMNLPKIDRYLEDGDVLGLGGGVQITVRHTPGHSAGGVCYSTSGCLFTGDTLFRGSIGRTDLPTGNYDAIMNSIKNVIFDYPDEVKVYPGHGIASSIAIEKASNPYFC